MKQVHYETLEEEATHVTDEARMVLPGVQAVLGFQLVAVFNQRFQEFTASEQVIHLGAFLLIALAMGLVMTPAAYHRQVERGCVSRRFVDLSSTLLTVAMLPLIAGVCLDTYLIARLILNDRDQAAMVAAGTALLLASLWYGVPALCRRLKS
ncbi:MAG: hypothetical protein HYX38_27840 [Rhodospirillales bacterium]|nr:hypothetical protein [Rhodospirillales bacterium]